MESKAATRRQLHRLFPSSLVLLGEIVALVVVSLELHPTERGFVEYDATLNHSYNADSTIPFWVAIVVPLLSLLLTIFGRNRKNLLASIGDIPWVLFFVTAGVTTAIVTEVVKNLVGRYRPDWLARCLPADPGTIVIDSFGATSSENPACTNTWISQSKLDDGMKSFPSGHSSTAFALGTIVVLYSARWMATKPSPSPLTMALLELWMALQISWAFGVATSRVIDNKHHIGDVVAGSMLGVLFGGMYGGRAWVETDPVPTNPMGALADEAGSSDSADDERYMLQLQ